MPSFNRASRPMTVTEGNVLGGLILLGLLPPAFGEAYDTTSVVLRIGLALLSLTVSFMVLRAMLGRLGVQHDRLIPATVWGLLGWGVIPLSHMAFVGYLLIPIEVALGATLASFRGGISIVRALICVSLARTLALAATVGARALF